MSVSETKSEFCLFVTSCRFLEFIYRGLENCLYCVFFASNALASMNLFHSFYLLIK